MSPRVDLLRSLVHGAIGSAARGLRALPGRPLRRLIGGLKQGRVAVADHVLTSKVACLPGVAAATVRASAGCLRVDVSYADGRVLAARLIPYSSRFAPGGAKEVCFRVQPADAARMAQDTVAVVAREIAHTLWGVLLGRADASGGLPVSLCDHDRVTVDLRDVPAVRSAMRRRYSAAVMDALDVLDVQADEGMLWLSLRIPGLQGTNT
ncbi:MAG: hypothetical protein MJD61_10345 [Proteobacteria bacterium]|nr:hypothetical protein [Pseudomonadota bacterium]